MASPSAPRGRGVASNPTGRFERLACVPDSDLDARERPAAVPTEYLRDTSRSVISRNTSPDVPFTFSLNPYRGCEHGCIYCYARPTHEYLGLSAGLDFETRILVKEDAPSLLREELARPSWRPETLALSGVTDPYQPIERTLSITRRCLTVLAECRQPVSLITKSSLVARDADVLGELARHRAAQVAFSITTLDESLRRALEPRAASGEARLQAMAKLHAAGIPVGVMVAPVIPGLNDHEMPAILSRAAQAGARFAGYIVVRLPHGVTSLFEQWLETHYPDRKARVLSRLRDLRGGQLTDPRFGSRMRGEGVTADFFEGLFRMARLRAGIGHDTLPLSSSAFRRPSTAPLFAGLDMDAEPGAR